MADLQEAATWSPLWRVDKYDAASGDLLDSIEIEGNILTYGGMSNIWQSLIGNGGTGDLEYFDNSNAYLGVGDSNTAAAATQTDLQAATNKLRKAMDATYPTHTDATTSGAATITFRSTYSTAQANWDWLEVACFNASSSGRMLNRKVVAFGTKTSAQQWVLSLTITLS